MKMTEYDINNKTPSLIECVMAIKDESAAERCQAAYFLEKFALDMLNGGNIVQDDTYWTIYQTLESMQNDPSEAVRKTIKEILWFREYTKAPRNQ